MNEIPSTGDGPRLSLRLAGRIAYAFISSKLTPLVILGALLLGAFAIAHTPREEEPQILVPMLDVFVQMPGASAEEVTQRATVPMEKLLREMPGVEYLYSISHPGLSMVIVRFYVGTNEEDACVVARRVWFVQYWDSSTGQSLGFVTSTSGECVHYFWLADNIECLYRVRHPPLRL